MIRTLPLLLACFAFTLPAAAERVMVGYYATFGDLPVEQVPWDRLTHLCHAFLRLDAEGEPVTTDAMPNPALTADGRKHGVPVLVTVGGGVTVHGLEKVTASEESTRRLAEAVLGVVRDGGYDGVDLDWESPRDAATREAHARLVRTLRRGLDGLAKQQGRENRYLLTATVSPSPFFGEFVDVDRVAPAVDWLSVMTYDMAGPWSAVAAHHAPLFASSKDPERDTRSVAAAMRYWEKDRGVPKDKLLMGVPMFGRAMPVAKPLAKLDPDRASRHRAMAFAAVRKLVGEGWPAEWDQESHAPWLTKPAPKGVTAPASPLTPVGDDDPDAGPLVIAYDDRNSVHDKTTWAREQRYGGVFFWAVHQDRMPDGRHWLLEAAGKAWPAE